MKYFRMSRKFGPNGAGLYKASHKFFLLKTGERLEEGFVPPLVVKLDPELPDGKLPTFFESPAWIATRDFHAELQALGIGNIEALPVEMRDEVHDRVIDDYLLLNIVGRVACANMAKSESRSLGEGMAIIDRLVIDPARIGGLELFVAEEDTDCMVISERVYRHLAARGYDDIRFEELEQVMCVTGGTADAHAAR